MHKKGFTLIELLIVVTIIGILAVALVPRIIGGSGAARDARRQTDLQSLTTGLESYLNDNGVFDQLSGSCPAADCVGGDILASDDAGLETSITEYLKNVPQDPLSDRDNDAFGCTSPNCEGNYVILLLEDDNNVLNRYAVGAMLEAGDADDENTYLNAPGTYTKYSDLNGLNAAGAAYYIIY